MNDLEMIHYNLNVLGGAYESDEMQVLIAKTILRLPKYLREKVPAEVTFICCDGMYGQYEFWNWSPLLSGKPFHFIILNLSQIISTEEKIYVIAHEIAHFVLGHYPGNIKDCEDIENEADTLCEKWGFTVPERRKEQ
jgi:hypothetical protein